MDVHTLTILIGRSIRTTGFLTAAVMFSLTLVAWLAIIPLMGSMTANSEMHASLPILSMGIMFVSPNASSLSFFLVVWIFGMVAMMFPAMIPIVSMYNSLAAKSEMRPNLARPAGTPLFLGGYLLLYAVLGAAAYVVTYLAFNMGALIPVLASFALPVAAGLLLATGVWQLIPMKDRCLSKCVSPMGFFLLKFKKGLPGAFRMGVEHGYYCVGCCWMYMLVMLGVGAMNIFSMVLLASLITVEKVIVHGTLWFRWVSASMFVLLGIALILLPSLFGF